MAAGWWWLTRCCHGVSCGLGCCAVSRFALVGSGSSLFGLFCGSSFVCWSVWFASVEAACRCFLVDEVVGFVARLRQLCPGLPGLWAVFSVCPGSLSFLFVGGRWFVFFLGRSLFLLVPLVFVFFVDGFFA